MLTLSAVLLILIGLAHSYLGEKYILIRLFKRELPKLFGDDVFTRQVLRFAWHITTIAWFGFAGILLVLNPEKDSDSIHSLYIISLVFFVSGLISFVFSKGKHYSYIVFWAVAFICAYVACTS